MAKLGDKSVGSTVYLKENGSNASFLVVHKGKPSDLYDDSCDGVWLMRVSTIGGYALNVQPSSVGTNAYNSTSPIQQYLEETYLSMLDPDVAAKVKTVKIPCRTSGSLSPTSTLTCKVFSLSAIETGYDRGSMTDDGSKLDYFYYESDSYSTARARREADRNYWTRTPDKSQGYSLMVQGGSVNGYSSYSRAAARPALLFPADMFVNNNNVVTINSAPTSPGSITVPDTIIGGEDTSIIWSAATDPDGNLDGYIVERSYNGGSSWSQIYQGRSTSTTTTIPFGTETVMFRVQAYDTAGAKSGWRTSANKTVVNNRAPAAPPSISVPLTPAGGESLSVTWTASTDTDGNLEGYELERQWDGAGAFTQIYKGAALSFQDDIPKGEHTSVVYRVRAYDSFASYSSYTTSPSRTIDNNTAPVISCDLSGDLGEKSEGFSVPYTVSDAEQQEVTVTEKVGDLVKRTYKPTLDQQNTFEVTGEYFQKILNGAQTVQIVATDSAGKSSTLELTFTKAVHKAVITLSEPLAVEEQITVAVLSITGDIPADATQLIELTNNGNDPEPVWEDATADVKVGRNYVFKNKNQSAGWAFNFRVTVERGESGENGNIVSIQGGFQ